MTRQRHYHPLAALRFLRKAVVVCLLPLANALLEFSLNALLTALRQDAALLLFLCGASSILLEASSWALDEAGVLRLRWAFISKRERIIRGEALAALTIERPLFFRLLGASRVVLYPVGQPAKRAVTLYLHKEDAQELADRLMPVRDPVCHRPAGGERAALVVLGANGLSTLALTYLAIRQSRPFPLTAEAVALSRLNVLVRFAAHWLPAGAAWMLVLTGALFGISLARSFVQTVHYTVWHTAGQLGSRGGWLSRFEFRVRSSEISYADVRVSPIARLMKRWPVFVVAGSCRPELPLFVYRSGQEELFRELLPEFRMPPDTRHGLTHRSAVFFAPAGIPFGLCLLLVLVSRSVLPALTGTLLIPTAVLAVFLAGGLMGWLKEGIWLREGRFTLRRQKGVYLHCICVFHPDVCLRTFQSPWAARYQRMTLTLALPGQVRLKVRSIPVRDAAPCLNALEHKIKGSLILMIKTILFDLDGTLLNTIDDLADAANWVCTQHGWPTFPVETYKHFVGNGIPKLVERFSPENARTPEQLAATLAEFSARYDAHKEDKTAPYPGILELLAALKAEGVQTAVFSNKADTFCGKIIEHYFGPDSFSLVRGSRPGVPTKPDPAGVYSLMADLGADPQSTLFVGDSDVDILTGHNAGLPALGVLWGFRGEAELTAAGADALAAKPEDILTYLHQH